MMHDANLRGLAGINKTPQDLTLDELKQIDIHENGYETKISSFDDYLNRANELHQKLLYRFVEDSITIYSKEMVTT